MRGDAGNGASCRHYLMSSYYRYVIILCHTRGRIATRATAVHVYEATDRAAVDTPAHVDN